MIEELKLLGLTDGEIKVYLALLKLGPATNSPIARNTGLQSSTVYYCLNSLIEKGFVSYIKKGDRKHFSPLNPEDILDVLSRKESELQQQKQRIKKAIPQLKQHQNVTQIRNTAEVYEGFQGFQATFTEILRTLKRGDKYEAFVIEQALDEPKRLKLLFMRHNKMLKEKGIKLRLLAPERMRSVFEKLYGKHFLKTYQNVRYTKEKTPVGITVYKDTVVTNIEENGRPISFKLTNNKLADSYREYFNAVWERAKP
ncbi:MAG: helix-turn-helix domain-containing protein [Candidatus Woesearchaeota archaeon]|jgi:sugar-specific transcriptional regulator TrmB|nr:helix-turn-helix domain-containing protein [Candidatus Woesearchaeota archaeon]MDP7181280.1 helix-turn-helix domain-containing protein [Candidatus Woesearchaeota archaeon]MDP7198101.1 helix-turn-helix domain-containing protein [Candidatus Woesearchaeota archaeon]MDP7466935.1 helix-turn-helix domain-containing protein [Candidatus Woesearchaeota archaeon]MDP7647371.1 helix-turn-helix domain-containing protein [Candidatus Woesearchaeota archaeon]|tara:strand:+ start:904 stop:1668 length:765 start_codon:yes stop_codon:yes gene_type:complete